MRVYRLSMSERTMSGRAWKVGVVIPCYRVADRVTDVIRGIGPEVHAIYCVDDACPEPLDVDLNLVHRFSQKNREGLLGLGRTLRRREYLNAAIFSWQGTGALRLQIQMLLSPDFTLALHDHVARFPG